jgi:phosphoribosyl-ATP pyrophosphohydrolase
MKNSSGDDALDNLMEQIHQRAMQMPEGSYTTELIKGGLDRMGAKILEEAAEVVDAAQKSSLPDNRHLIYESCDLIYHLWVLLGSRGVTVDQLRIELARREGVSGLEEKRSRKTSSGDLNEID